MEVLCEGRVGKEEDWGRKCDIFGIGFAKFDIFFLLPA